MSTLPLLTAACIAPPLLARWRRQPHAVTLFFLAASIVAVGVAGLVSIFVEWQAGWLLVGVLPSLCVASVLPPKRSGAAQLLAALAAHRRLKGLVLMAATFVVLLGGTEWSILLLVRTGLLELESPIITVLVPGSEDWREASIIGDFTREPDPVLFWRSRPIPPYNAQRFQGPIAVCPKPDNVFRIMCYGDSNTDGHVGDGGWPARLAQRLVTRDWLRKKSVEVINAGVMGYSSHQGLMRFREEAAEYRPDLIFVSFGWNDAPAALGKADNEFEIPSSGVLYLQRTMLRFRFYRLIHAATREGQPSELKTVGPRVSIEDYVANLRSFCDVAKRYDTEVVLLTRPHKESVAKLRAMASWRRTIPDYNTALLEFASRDKVPCVDVAAEFGPMADKFVDECHFSSEGHEWMVGLLSKTLADLHTR